MRRHLVTLERERQNIDEAVRLCALLKDKEMPLSQLDAQSVLEEMEMLEQSGATFQNKQQQDIRIRYIAPIAIAAAAVVVLAALAGLFVWGLLLDSANAPPLAAVVVLLAVLIFPIIGVLLALFQRIREISKGEADDAKKY